MPVRYLNSYVLKWPERAEVERAARSWAESAALLSTMVRRIGYYGSCARGEWGMGSDLDLLVIVNDSDRDFFHRSAEWDTSALPVPVDLLVYTETEWHEMNRPGFAEQVVWIYNRSASTD